VYACVSTLHTYVSQVVTVQRTFADWVLFRLTNRTGDWVRMICVVLGAEPVKVEVSGETKELGEAWLQ